MQHDYDEYYDTKVSRPFGRSKIGMIFGVLLLLIGLADIIITLVDLYLSNFTLDRTQSNNAFVYTWDENPFWPTYGKGFWVGLIVFVTGIAGIVAFCEHTITSIYAFAALCTASAIFSFYLLISASIPLAKYNDFGSTNNLLLLFGQGYYNSLNFNATLLSLGGLGFILSSVAGVLSCLLVGCCSERRGYGGQFLENYYRSVPANSPINRQAVPYAATNPAFQFN